MIISHGDIWEMPDGTPKKNAICVTTNSVIKKNGEAVMGRGIAKQANDRYQVSRILAAHLKQNGNHVGILGHYTDDGHAFYLLSFPTKEDWKQKSTYQLIRRSAAELVELVDRLGIEHCYLTPPGCGNGGLYWPYVAKFLEPVFDNRFVILNNR